MSHALSVALSGNRDVDALLWGTAYTARSFSYSFPSRPSYYYSSEAAFLDGSEAYFVLDEPRHGFQELNARQIVAVEHALAEIAGITALEFRQVVETDTTIADFRFAESRAVATAHGTFPENESYSGDTWFNRSDYNRPAIGSLANMQILHEIGHGLGLKHAHEREGFSGEGVSLAPAHDSLELTVMTYRSYERGPLGSYTVEAGSFPATYMMLDIQALQHLYGANYTTRSRDTVYSWSEKSGELAIDGVKQGRPVEGKVFMTVWDGGGEDAYDLSRYGKGVTIDLAPGGWSVLARSQLADLGHDQLARGSVANALLFEGDERALIENAIGGRGNDWLKGNQAHNVLEGGRGNDRLLGRGGGDELLGGQGDDRLVGGRGADVLEGGAGSDRFVIGAVSGIDRIVDFTAGLDVLDLRAFDLGSLAGLQSIITASPDGVRLLLDADTGVLIEHVTLVGFAAIDVVI